MKKITALFLVFAIVASFSACNENNNDDELQRLQDEIEMLEQQIQQDEQLENEHMNEQYNIDDNLTEIDIIEAEQLEYDVTDEPQIIIPENPDFRNTVWGMSFDDVFAIEDAEFIEQSDLNLVYSGKIGGYDTLIAYFIDDIHGLYKGFYSLQTNHGRSTQLYISNYITLKDSLVLLYGNPYEDDILILSTLAEYADETTALTLGYTAYSAKWKTENTEITLFMMSNERSISTSILYEAIDINIEADLFGF